MDRERSGHSPFVHAMAAATLTHSVAVGLEDRASGVVRPAPASLYRTHFAFVWRNLRRLGVPDPQLEDAAQDVFLTVHRRWDSYDERWSAVETWLFGIVLRVAQGHRRSLRRRLSRLVPWSSDSARLAPSSEEGPAELVAKRQAVLLLDRLLAELRPERRAVLILVDVEQLSVPQAAEALGTNLNTAYSRLRSARLQFERSLKRLRATDRSGVES
jgi:RNA polymerase sigma-70 factor (ECF subfamily)